MTGHRPSVDQADRDLIEDLGLVNDYMTDTDDPVALHNEEALPS